MAAERYSTTSLDLVRDTCPACHGSGEAAAVLEVACAACGQAWSLAHFDTWIEGHDRGGRTWLARWLSFIVPGGRNRYRWEHLPCGCPMKALSYQFASCGICRGAGTIAWMGLRRHLHHDRQHPHREPRLCVLPKPSASQVLRNPPVPPITDARIRRMV